MAILRRTPTSQHLSFQRFQLLHQFRAAEQVLLELLDASIPAVLVDLEGISPLASNCTLHIVIMPSDVDMIGIFQPLQQVFIPHLAQELHLHVYHSRLALLLLLHVFNLLRFLLRLLMSLILFLLLEERPFWFGFEELLLHVLHLLRRLHYSLTNYVIF